MAKKTSRTDRQKQAAAEVLGLYSPKICSLFERYLVRYFAKNFHGVRVSLNGPIPAIPEDQGLVVYANHSSWWDPLIMYYLARTAFPGRRGFGPIDAKAVQKYKFMFKIGLYPVEQETPRGALHFLDVSHGILAEKDTSLWLTPQGQFVDNRIRPIEFKAGIAHLARDCDNVVFLPLALEYCFWKESKQELLIRFGAPLVATEQMKRTAEDWQLALERGLQDTQDKLAVEVMSRDPSKFTSLISGGGGVGFAYDTWRRIKALVSGGKFSATHGDE